MYGDFQALPASCILLMGPQHNSDLKLQTRQVLLAFPWGFSHYCPEHGLCAHYL